MEGDYSQSHHIHLTLEKYGQFQGLLHAKVFFHGVKETDISHEITFNARALNLDSEEVFFYDENGLKMEEKKLNYRDEFKVFTWVHTSSNFYPVHSAITAKDLNNGL